MSVRLALTALAATSGCALYVAPSGDDAPIELPCPGDGPGCESWDACLEGDCYEDFYECDPTTGEWVAAGICHPRAGYFYGDLLLEQSFEVAPPTCPPLTPRNRLAMFVQSDGTIIGAAPVEVVASQSGSGGYGENGTLEAIVADNWSGTPVTITYDLEVSPYDSIWGTGTLNLPDCTATLQVTGVQCPDDVEPCVVYDDGWNVWCDQGEVFEDDLTRVGYCLPGETEELCQTGGEPHLARIATCANGCAIRGVVWFETFEERSAFDATSLCAR